MQFADADESRLGSADPPLRTLLALSPRSPEAVAGARRLGLQGFRVLMRPEALQESGPPGSSPEWGPSRSR
jgi:hypothetical protein